MFLDNLSYAVLRLCNENQLSYKAASERCCLNPRSLGNIVRCKTVPTILTLEKLCTGFNCTPNDLLLLPSSHAENSFREPMLVTRICCYKTFHSKTAYPICPRCSITLDREYQTYCDRCGQRLDWSRLRKATIIKPLK